MEENNIKISQIVKILLEEYPKTSDLAKVLKAILDAIKEIKEQVEQNIANNRGELSGKLQNVLNNLTDNENRVKKLVSDSQQKFLNELDQIKLLIPDPADLSPLQQKFDISISELEKKIPQLPQELKPEQVRDKLETLKDGERLDISAIKGISKRLSKLSDEIINRAIGILDSRTSFLIQRVSNLSDRVSSLGTGSGGGHVIEDEGTPLTQRANLNFVGGGVTAADSGGKTVVTISGATVNFTDNEVATGSGTSFTIAATPVAGSVHVYAVGQRLKLTTDYTISGTTITTVFSWNAGDIIVDYRT